ncbi:sulfatase-like hydrolase/transferase, partial [Cupriavidus sp. CuC1]|uniref:sulfatase-like hydrolase/transferase n=1 Tax=Cupriavidus sp. CuC1 TaxID=3373131 RepID=UPI0037D092EA
MGGNTSQWEPALFENTSAVPPSKDPNYHLSVDLADHAISWVEQVNALDPDRPYFLYLAPGATHSPHHVPKEWIDKFKGKFDTGWDVYREETLARQKRLGVVPADTKLTPRPPGIPAWDTLQPDQKRLYARMMEVFAAFGAHVDLEMGRVVDVIQKRPDGDNTLIFYVAGDNGASAEGGLEGALNEIAAYSKVPMKWQDMVRHIDDIGSRKFAAPSRPAFIDFPSFGSKQVCNLRDNVERLLYRLGPQLRQAAQQVEVGGVTLGRQGLLSRTSLRSWQRLSDQRRATRLALYDRVMALRALGGTMKGIGRELSIDHRTVRKFITAGAFP